jgi:hypothetical protein
MLPKVLLNVWFHPLLSELISRIATLLKNVKVQVPKFIFFYHQEIIQKTIFEIFDYPAYSGSLTILVE